MTWGHLLGFLALLVVLASILVVGSYQRAQVRRANRRGGYIDMTRRR